jgi:hypothetical protein
MIVAATLHMLLSTTACASDSHPIENGTYIARSGEDRISAQDEDLHFVLTITEDGQQRVFDRSYSYTVLPDGRIQPHPVRSADAVFGIGRFDWYWDGNEIIQKAPSGAEVNRFVRQP